VNFETIPMATRLKDAFARVLHPPVSTARRSIRALTSEAQPPVPAPIPAVAADPAAPVAYFKESDGMMMADFNSSKAPDAAGVQLVSALNDFRDALVSLSLSLHDCRFAMDEQQRQAAMAMTEKWVKKAQLPLD
jgi:2-methylisocitrate lyase-like PEP mutase family enzyme